MEEKTMNVNSDTAANPTTGGNVGTAAEGKLFTQDEVNRIVSERLNRERMKAEPTEQETREVELSKRENRLECREFLLEKKYSTELLDILDTTDANKFKETSEKLAKLFPGINEGLPGVGKVATALNMGMGHIDGNSLKDNLIRDAFKPKT